MKTIGGKRDDFDDDLPINFDLFLPEAVSEANKPRLHHRGALARQQNECLDKQVFDFSGSSFTEEAADAEDVEFLRATVNLSSPCTSDVEAKYDSIGNFQKFSSIGIFAFLMIASFVAGRCTRFSPHPEAVGENTFSDEFLRSQEWLLLQLAKTHSVEEHETEFTRHLSLLVDEMKLKSEAVKDTKNKLSVAEQQANEAWSEFRSRTSQLEAVDHLRQVDTQKLLRTVALERYGNSQNYVEFEVRVPGSGMRSHFETMYFTIEMADVALLPASVYVFLQQVNQGLWDNTSFQINAPHTLTAQPTSIEGASTNEGTMADLGLQRVPVLEYSNNYRHDEYSVGLSVDNTGRPGPDFYINKSDNSDVHDGLPCIGRVVIGSHTIDRISSIQNPNGSPYFQNPIEIVSARHLTAVEDAVGGLAYATVLKKIQIGKDF